MPDVIVPRKCVAELRKLLEELEGTVEVSLSATKIRFGLGSAVLTSKLIDGTFPDYNRVIPTANDKLLKLDPKSFCGRRRPRLDHRHREDPRGQDERRSRQGDAVGHLARKTAPRPRSCRPTMARTGSRSASTPATCSTSSARSTATRSKSTSPTPRRRPCCARTTSDRALRADADAGLNDLPSLARLDYAGECRRL